MSINEPLVKSMPGRNPEPPVTHPSGGMAREIIPGIRSRAENRKYQPRLPTMLYIYQFLQERIVNPRMDTNIH